MLLSSSSSNGNNNSSHLKNHQFKKSLSLFIFKSSIFALLQLVFYFGPSRGNKEVEFQYNLAISSSCWLTITLIWGIIEGFRVFIFQYKNPKHKRIVRDSDSIEGDLDENNNNFSNDDDKNVPPTHDGADAQRHGDKNCTLNNSNSDKSIKERSKADDIFYRDDYRHSILLIPQTDWRTQSSSLLSRNSMEIKSRDKTTSKLFITPWALWFYIYACGISLFVLGYCIHGMSMLPQISTIIASMIVWPWIASVSKNDDDNIYKNSGPEKDGLLLWFPIGNLSSLGVCISLCLVVLDDIIAGPHAWILWVSKNLWMGIIVPAMCSALLCKCSQQASIMHIAGDKVLMFAMPSLAMMSVTFLSIYFPMHGVFSSEDFFHVNGINTNNKSLNLFSDYYYYNSNVPSAPANFNKSFSDDRYDSNYGSMDGDNNITSDYYDNISSMMFENKSVDIILNNNNYGLDMFYYWGNYTQFMIEKFVESKSGWDFHPFLGVGWVSIFLTVIAPVCLWFAMIAVIAAAIKSVSGIQSTLSGIALVATIRQLILGERTFCIILSVVMLVPSCILTVYNEALLYEFTERIFLDSDNIYNIEDDEEDIIFQNKHNKDNPKKNDGGRDIQVPV